jgi:uncharacterized protein YeaC (DUF1315 family)
MKINGKEYDPDSLTKEQKYFAMQIKLLQEDENNLNLKMAQVRVAKEVFLGRLIKYMEDGEIELTTENTG